jgi:putative holliday junction resolvase
MRWIGLDYGEKRIGIAISDPMEFSAGGLKALERTGSLRKDLAFLKQLIQEHEVEGVVLGLPRNMNGTEGPAVEKVRSFGRELEKTVGIKIVYWDEWLSTCSAQRVLIEADLSRRKRKGKVDQLAAAIILQNYLDSKNKN